MSTNNLQNIALQGVPFTAEQFCVLDKLTKFNYAAVLNDGLANKTFKAIVAIHSILVKTDNPQIAIICPKEIIYAWHQAIITEIGIDFKVLILDKNIFPTFFDDTYNFYLICEEDLAEENFLGARWDLVIVDSYNTPAEFNIGRSEQALVFKPYKGDKTIASVNGIVKNLKIKPYDKLVSKKEVEKFNVYIPFMKYFEGEYQKDQIDINVLNYSTNEEILKGAVKILNPKTGEQANVLGGSLFLEYGIAERYIFQKDSYTNDDLKVLRNADKKLDAFLAALENIIYDKGNTILIYAQTLELMDYLRKVILAVYSEKSGFIKQQCGRLYDTMGIKSALGENDIRPQILIAGDDNLEKLIGCSEITHIFNYEIIKDVPLIKRRINRFGKQRAEKIKLYFFKDENKLFDSGFDDKLLADFENSFDNLSYFDNEKYIDFIKDIENVKEWVCSQRQYELFTEILKFGEAIKPAILMGCWHCLKNSDNTILSYSQFISAYNLSELAKVEV